MKIKTSKTEIKDLFLAWIALSLAFAILLLRGSSSLPSSSLAMGLLINFVVAGIAVGLGFIVHELSHKIVAQYYGAFAEFRANKKMLGFAVIFSFFGFIFAAPGAVMISGHISKARNGKISMAGPLSNLIIALIFFLLMPYASGIWAMITQYGFLINSWLAAFNLLPFFIFDGKKIYTWNKFVWGALALIAVVFVFFL